MIRERAVVITRAEAAFLLGIKPASIRALVERGALDGGWRTEGYRITFASVVALTRSGYNGLPGGRGHRYPDHCIHGHRRTPTTLYGHRCRICQRLSQRARRGVLHPRVWP